MRNSRKRDQSLLGDVLPQFLKAFMIRVKQIFKKDVSINHEDNSLLIVFDFAVIKCREVYDILIELCQQFNTRGILNKLTVELAKVTNLAVRGDNLYDYKTIAKSIYRNINRYK